MLARVTKLVWVLFYVFIVIDTLIHIAGMASNWYIANYLDEAKIQEKIRSWVAQGIDPVEMTAKVSELQSLLASLAEPMRIITMLPVILLPIAQILSYLNGGERKYLIYLGITLFTIVVVGFLSSIFPVFNFLLFNPK